MSTDTEDFPPTLEEVLERIVKKEKYVSYKIEKKVYSTKGIGFLAKPFFITIKGQTKDGEKQTNVYAKTAVPCSHIDEILDIPHAFASEALVYNDLSKIFTELQDEAGIPPADRFKMIKSYGVSNKKAIFLENVAIEGYESVPRTATMTLQIAELAIKEIAKFHAFTFIIREKRPDFYKIIQSSTCPILCSTKTLEGMLHIMKSVIKYVDDSLKEKVECLFPELVKQFKVYNQGDAAISCLCHGDFRLHNLLVKQKCKDVDLFVVDYQLIHMNTPVHDLIYFLFMGTDGPFRKNHFENLKNLYYDFFSEFLTKFGINSDNVYPKSQYENDFKERLDYGLICALYFVPFVLGADDEIPNPEEQSLTDMDLKVHESYPERLRDILNDFVQWGLL